MSWTRLGQPQYRTLKLKKIHPDDNNRNLFNNMKSKTMVDKFWNLPSEHRVTCQSLMRGDHSSVDDVLRSPGPVPAKPDLTTEVDRLVRAVERSNEELRTVNQSLLTLQEKIVTK
jgi:hypothetical protein